MGSKLSPYQTISYLFTVSQALGTLEKQGGTISEIIGILKYAERNGNRVWVIGNGGSASTASHFANDLTKMAHLPAIALPDLTTTLLAYGNDGGWENMFSDLLGIMARKGDVLVAITCSGRSENIIRAAKTAGEMDCQTIVLTGNREGNSFDHFPNTIFVEMDDIRIQEDCHLALCHLIAGAVAEA
jgi:D-sedoheptulose 7-phosphate isomerase